MLSATRPLGVATLLLAGLALCLTVPDATAQQGKKASSKPGASKKLVPQNVARADQKDGDQGDGQNGQAGDQGEKQNGQAGNQGEKQNGQAGDQGEKQNGQAGNQGEKQNGQNGDQGDKENGQNTAQNQAKNKNGAIAKANGKKVVPANNKNRQGR